MQDAAELVAIATKFLSLAPLMDERMRRQWAAAEARAYGWGGVRALSSVIGMSPNTIKKGLAELTKREEMPDMPLSSRLRVEGGGRKRCSEADPELVEALEQLVDPATRGDPESPLRWTCKSTTHLAAVLTKQGHSVSPRTVGRLLNADGYSLQSNRKTKEGADHPDRNAQFEHINATVKQFQHRGQPVISVDTKKKELVGDFKNSGRELRPQGKPEKVRVHDFLIPELGRATPYGIYDLAQNTGWVSVGMDHDTAAFAVESIRRWWQSMGQPVYPKAHRLLITADAGGSNGPRLRLWKVELQKLADETGLRIAVCHFPPGTSKWNKIEHRLFSFISQNWRGKPLLSFEVIVNLIAATTTTKGLKVQAELDSGTYPAGTKIDDSELAGVRLRRDAFHGDWNYEIHPHPA
jgi:transposase